MTRLVPICSVRPSTYNPRTADPRRLDLVELSLRKLGWLLPIYAGADGEILSGHQRHHVAERMGLQQVPVCFTKAMPLPERKAINIAFNRGTNDLDAGDTPKDLSEALSRSGVMQMAGKLRDIPPGSAGFNRCMNATRIPIAPLLRANSGHWVKYAANIAKTLWARGIVMPVIVRPDMQVVNGIGRLEMLAKRGERTVEVVRVTAQESRFAGALLNLLSMDFDIHRRYRDLLRYNSFRRARRVRAELGRGFVFAVIGGRACHTFDIGRKSDRDRWVRVHGSSVLDFGAGHLHETDMLRRAGIRVTAFEPYRIDVSERIDKAASAALARVFLADVAAGIKWSSMFISSVLNSVPFEEDRRHIVTLLAALAGPTTGVYAVASSRKQAAWNNLGRQFLNEKTTGLVQFRLDYEDGITLGEIATNPKVQKHHTAREMHDLFSRSFSSVTARDPDKNVELVARCPRPIDAQALRAAINFEFDLPYPDGSTMGMADAARSAFSKRLGVRL